MAYKQNFKSPILKALVGKQRNLPQHLQDAIKAAPESPAKLQDTPKSDRKAVHEKMRDEMKKRSDSRPKTTTKQKMAERELSKMNDFHIDSKTGDIKFKKKSPKSPAKLQNTRAGKKGPKQTPEARKKMIEKMNKAYDKGSKSSIKPGPGPKLTPQERKAIAQKMLKKYEGGPKSPAKKNGPGKGDKYKGGGAKTDAQMSDRTRRVNEGLTVRRNDYAPGKDGQAAFNADRRASFDNRRAKHADVRARLKSGKITKQEANRERNAYAKDIYNSRSTKKSKADRNMGDAPTTYVVSRKGIKRKVSDAEKASYKSVAKKYKK